uniref:Uncharacterized protein n=1 Tax=Acanthochromis polyacanthus TaxID=80966 RepID=A0A3Q1GYM5_9TELE
MGGKLSRKRKGYDVSDPKDKKDEAAATPAGAEESAKVEDGAPPTGAAVPAQADSVVEETADSDCVSASFFACVKTAGFSSPQLMPLRSKKEKEKRELNPKALL